MNKLKAEQMQPLGDHILIRRDDADDRSAGGLILPDMAKTPPSRGVVVAVGPGKRTEGGSLTKMWVEPGQLVYFEGFHAHDLGNGLFIIAEEGVVAVEVE